MGKKRIPYSTKELFAQGPQRGRTGRELDHIAFPLGGIGTGMISLGGWGQLRDWEIMNRPAKGFGNDMAFFTVRAQPTGSSGQGVVARVIQGPAEATSSAGDIRRRAARDRACPISTRRLSRDRFRLRTSSFATTRYRWKSTWKPSIRSSR